jgi:hypothetical protein
MTIKQRVWIGVAIIITVLNVVIFGISYFKEKAVTSTATDDSRAVSTKNYLCSDADKARYNFMSSCIAHGTYNNLGGDGRGTQDQFTRYCKCLAENFDTQAGADVNCQYEMSGVSGLHRSEKARHRCTY